MTTILCFYHAPCNDGSAAAATLEYRLQNRSDTREGEEIDIRFAPMSYNTDWNDPFPESYLQNEVQPKHPVSEIYFVDISVSNRKFDQLYEHLRADEKIAAGAIPVVCIDHHQSAIDRHEELRQYCTETLIRIGPGLSGATLVWEYFNQRFNVSEPVPLLLRYVADQDVWEWQLPDSKEVNASLNVLSGSVDEMRSELAHSLESPDEWLRGRREAGRAITELVESQVLRSKRQVVEYPFSDGILLVVNATSFSSELGNYLCEQHERRPDVVAMIYSVQEDWSVRCSLRSLSGGKRNARAIAEVYGGGGHDNAAGCRFSDVIGLRNAIDEIAKS